jgi:apolipoprotein N-acyltransferase
MPEVTFPDIVRGRPTLARAIHGVSLAAGAPVVFGAYGYVLHEDERLQLFNSAFLMTRMGLAPYQYDKQYLVPFVERVPFLPPEWFSGLQYFGGLGVGEGPTIGESPVGRFGVLICYESTYPQASRAFRGAGADLLLNITNDSWYGREPLYSRTLALWQHPAHMVMRAIENRMGVARAANTGISLFVDPVGRITSRTSLFEADVLVDTVYTTDVRTFYAYAGDLAGYGAALATLVLFGVAWRSARRSG